MPSVEISKVERIIKKHTNCRGPHKTNEGYVSCLIMVLSELKGVDPWKIVKELGVELR